MMYKNSISSSILYKVKKTPINWKMIHKICPDKFADPIFRKIYAKGLVFHKLSAVDLRTVPKFLLKKYLILIKLVLDQYETESNELKAQLFKLEQFKSLNFLKKIQIESKLNSILPKLDTLHSIYHDSNQLVNSIYKEFSCKNVGKIEEYEIKPCKYCKKMFKNLELCEIHQKKRHISPKLPPSINTSKLESFEHRLHDDLKNFTNLKVDEFLNSSKVNFETMREIHINSLTLRNTSFLTHIENEYKGQIEEIKEFKNAKIRESQIFKLELENELLRIRKNTLDTDLENLKNSRIQSFSPEKVKKNGSVRKNKWKKWVNDETSYQKHDKVKLQALNPEKVPESFEVQVPSDHQSLINPLKLKNPPVIDHPIPDISIIPKDSSSLYKESPLNSSKSSIFLQSPPVFSLKDRLFLLFSPASKHNPSLPLSNFPISHALFTSTRSLLSKKLNTITAQLKTSITDLELTLKLVSKTFK